MLSNRFALPLGALILFLFLVLPRLARSLPSSPAEGGRSQTSPQFPPPNEIPPLVTGASEPTNKEQYTLSHEKYEKAVA